MWKKLVLVLVAALAVTGTAYAADAAPAADLGQDDAAVTFPLRADFERVDAASGDEAGGAYQSCSATAYCNGGGSVSCTASGSGGTCSYQHANCSQGQRGYVRCNGVTTWCPACPPSQCSPRPGCTYTFNKLTYCCIGTPIEPGNYCPNICW